MSIAGFVLASAVALTAPAIPVKDTTVVYIFPTSPQMFVPVRGLPSFLAMPGAPLPAIATEVVYTTAGPALPAPIKVTSSGHYDNLTCSDFVGTVRISGFDRFHLDRDGDGVGCETEDR